jgi:hypothetical protein
MIRHSSLVYSKKKISPVRFNACKQKFRFSKTTSLLTETMMFCRCRNEDASELRKSVVWLWNGNLVLLEMETSCELLYARTWRRTWRTLYMLMVCRSKFCAISMVTQHLYQNVHPSFWRNQTNKLARGDQLIKSAGEIIEHFRFSVRSDSPA